LAKKYLKKVYKFYGISPDDKNGAYTWFEIGPFEYYSEAKKIQDKYKKKRKYKNWEIGIDCHYIDNHFSVWEKGFVHDDD
jgi:hypothetical protein